MRILRSGTELRRFWRSPMSRAAIVVVTLIPLLYGALYLWAFWNPTGHLDRLPAAIVDADAGTTGGGDGTVNAGKEITDSLLKTGTLSWHVTNAADAATGLESGDYYAVLTIPARFSQAVTTVGTNSPVHAPLQVSYNDANGYTARTIVNSVMTAVRTSVSNTIGSSMVDQVLVGIGDIHGGVAKAASGAERLAAGASAAVTGANTLASGTSSLVSGASSLASGLTNAKSGADTLVVGSNQVSTGAASMAAQIPQAAAGAAAIAGGGTQVAGGAETLANGAADLATGSTTLSKGAATLAASLSSAAKQAADLPTQANSLDAGAQQVAAGATQLATTLSGSSGTLTSAAAQVRSALVAQLPGGASNPAVAAYDAMMSSAETQLTSAAAGASQLAGGASTLASGTSALAGAAPSVSQGYASAAAGAAKLSTGASSVATGAASLNTGATKLAAGAGAVSSGASTLAGQLTAATPKAKQLASGAQQLASGLSSLDSGISSAASGASSLASGASTLAAGAHRLDSGVAQLSTGATSLSTGLKTAIAQIPDLSSSAQSANADVISAPVTLNTTFSHQAEGNGEGFAPYFIGLALYVGAMILWMLLRPLSPRSLAAPVQARRVVLSNLLPGLLLGTLQVAFLLLTLKLALGLHSTHLLAASSFALLVSFGFVALLQTVNIWFGTSVGRLVTLILLMLQLTSAGGTYPVAASPSFFRALHMVLPLTQVVNGLRESITGGLGHNFWVAVAYFAGLIVASLAASSWGAMRNRVFTMSRLHPAVSL